MSGLADQRTCAICEMSFESEAVQSGAGIIVCPRCGQPSHADCWDDAGGCRSARCGAPEDPSPSWHAPAVEDPPQATGGRSTDATDLDDLIEIVDVRGGGPMGAPARPSAPLPPSMQRLAAELEITEEDLEPSASEVRPWTPPPPAPRRDPPAPAAAQPHSSWTSHDDDPWAASRMGMLGRRRPVGRVVLMHAATLFLYQIPWVYSLFQEAHEYADGRREIRVMEGRTALGVFVITPLLVLLLGAPLFVLALRSPGELPTWMSPTLAYVLPFFGLPFAAAGWFHTAGLVTRMRLASGVRPAQAGRTSADALLCLVPVLGRLAFCGRVQGRMNRYWEEEAQMG